jgi:ATP-dependent DNA helicase RecQ
MILEDALKQHFGYNTFRANQKEIIAAILENKDVLAILPTGAGKSLCYQLPAVLLPGTAIVVSPLISLMQDQVESLSKNGIEAAYINSSLHFHDLIDILHSLSHYKILFVAPERFTDKSFIAKLKQTDVSMIVIDEAHCISQWGHSFRPEYRQLAFLKETFQKPILALTATATQEVQNDIHQQLAMKNPYVVKASFDRPNLTIRVNQRSDQNKQLIEFLNLHKSQSGIIYCSTRKTVETVYQDLTAKGFKPGKYHAGLPDKERTDSQKSFIHDETQLMVATVAFGMGIHKPDVRFIVHVDMPKTIEQYYQEIGRAGRDGLPAECLMLYATKDLMVYKSFLEKDADPEFKKNMMRKTELMYRLCTSGKCRRVELLRYFGESAPFSQCQSCDNCLDDVNLIEGVVIAQKILSCVHRLNHRFGMRYVMEVLRGAKTKQIFDHRHDELSTYNLMPECSEQELRYYIESLIELGHLKVSDGQYPLLQWTETSMDVVKGNIPVKFRKKIFRESKKSLPCIDLDYDVDLFGKLRELRRDIAQKEKVPPYVVFSDRSLTEMAVHYPQTQPEFVLINGVGPIKWHKYGKVFVELIAKHCEDNAIRTPRSRN